MCSVTTTESAVLALFKLVLRTSLFIGRVIPVATISALQEDVAFFVFHDLQRLLMPASLTVNEAGLSAKRVTQ